MPQVEDPTHCSHYIAINHVQEYYHSWLQIFVALFVYISHYLITSQLSFIQNNNTVSKSQFDSSYFQRNTFYAISSSIRRRQWQPTPVLLPGKSHGQKSRVGYSSHGVTELDTAEWLHFHFSVSCIGEGNGNPLQCSCLENPRDGGAWWAAVYGVTQSWTRLKWLSSSSSSPISLHLLAYSHIFICLTLFLCNSSQQT